MFRPILEKFGLVSEKLKTKTLATTTQPNANTAETVQIDLPTDMLLYAIDLYVNKKTAGTASDAINEVRLILDGNKYVKKMTGTMVKTIDQINGYKPSAGFYKIWCVDPHVGADPIPTWLLSSCVLEVDVAAQGASEYAQITPTLTVGLKESMPIAKDFSLSKILVEKYLKHAKFGTNTGWQEYKHERTYKIYGYVYEMDDNGTLSDSIFNKLTLKLISKEEELEPYTEALISQLKENLKQELLGNALPTGEVYVPFPDGLKSYRFSSIYSYLNIPSAGTNAGLKVLERYVVGGGE